MMIMQLRYQVANMSHIHLVWTECDLHEAGKAQRLVQQLVLLV